MNKLPVISFVLGSAIVFAACSDVKRERGREYMPDMAYSRAYETYAPREELAEKQIHYTAMPVAGTIKRGETFPFSIPRDNDGDSTNYVASRQVPNPIPPIDSLQLKEAERLYLVNCGICHGTALDGNGPLYKDGTGPYPAAPKNLVGPEVTAMPDGQIFYSITYGKGQMGPYGSQLNTSQRWRVVHYIRSKQKKADGAGSKTSAGGSDSTAAGAGASTTPSTGSTASAADSAKMKK